MANTENIENFVSNQYLNLPDELLNNDDLISSNQQAMYEKQLSPIGSPKNSQKDKSLNIKTIEIPINTNDIKSKPLQSLDLNTDISRSRPKRAAALVASSNLKNLKRKFSDPGPDSSNKENLEISVSKQNVNSIKLISNTENSFNKKLNQKGQKKRKVFTPKPTQTSRVLNQKTQKENLEDKSGLETNEEEVVMFLSQHKTILTNCLIDPEQSCLPEKININNQKFQQEEPTLQLNANDVDEPIRYDIGILGDLDDIPLNLECQSDNEYDFSTPQDNPKIPYSSSLNSKLLNPTICNPKLSDFIVTRGNLSNSYSNQSLHTPVKIDKMYTFNNYNYIIETDELGLTVCHATEINLDQHLAHQQCLDLTNENDENLDPNNNKSNFENLNNLKNQTNELENKIIVYNGVDLLSLVSSNSQDDMAGYALNVCKVLFTKDEILNGIFVDAVKKNKSKNRVPFDNHRTQILKEALIFKFKIEPNDIELVFKSIRAELNKKLCSYKKKTNAS